MVTKKELDHFLNPPEKPKAPTRQERLHAIVTPLWDFEMGQRLKLMRMMLHLDQTRLGDYLGVSQKTISDIENGRTRLAPFSVGRLEGMFGDRVGYILLNSSPERFSPTTIVTKYWATKNAAKGDRRTLRQGVNKLSTLAQAAETAQRQYEYAKKDYEQLMAKAKKDKGE